MHINHEKRSQRITKKRTKERTITITITRNNTIYKTSLGFIFKSNRLLEGKRLNSFIICSMFI